METIRVLAFTNWDKTSDFSPSIKMPIRARGWSQIYPAEPNRLIVQCIDDSGPAKLQPVSDFSDPGVYLVYDGISQEQLNPLLNPLEQSDGSVFILYHTHGYNNDGNGCFTNDQRDKFFIRQGAHNNLGKALYYPLFQILTDSTTDKIKRIQDWACQKMVDMASKNLYQDFGSPVNSVVGSTRFNRDYSFIRSQGANVKDSIDNLLTKYKISNCLNDYWAELDRFRGVIDQLLQQ